MRTQASSGDRVISARTYLPAALAGLALLAGCGSGSGGSGSTGSLFIQTCSLNCSVGSGGDQVFCIVRNVTENGEVSVTFSDPIDPTTLTPSTFQVTDVGNGTAPDGLRFLDPLDPRRVIFRPAITFVGGSVAFSLQQNRSYEIRVPGVQQGDSGPFIRSVGGSPNQSRMLCTIETTEGIEDIVPGNPEVDVFVDVDVTAPGGPFTTERTQIGSSVQNAVENVAASSKIYFEFNELMNLPTVANVVTGESLTIFVELDTDGDISTSGADRIPIPGTFELEVDQFTLTTSATFTPFGDIPSAGQNRRLLVVRVTTLVKDIANNSVTSASGGGVLVAVPEILTFSQIVLPDEDGEGFTNSDLENTAQTGAAWGGGRLSVGLTGGSGRHGSIRVAAGESLVLDTDSQTFPATGIAQIDVLGNDSGAPGAPVYPYTLTVTDGVFELSSLVIEPTGTLILRGSNAARILVRGRCDLQPGSVVDLSGESAPEHNSSIPGDQVAGAAQTLGGPNGASGGLGADRADLTGNNLTDAGGISNPGANRDGIAGGGVGGSATAAGLGGVRFPNILPTQSSVFAGSIEDTTYNVAVNPRNPTEETCTIQQLGASGGGGGFALAGGEGTSQPVGAAVGENPVGVALSPGNTPGGDVTALGLAAPNVNNVGYDTRLLRWEEGDLRGGSAGGGGGNHIFGTINNAGGAALPPPITNCVGAGFTFVTIEADMWLDHSGAKGGAGGGAVEFLAGREAILAGLVDASGGFGGGALSVLATNGSFAMPGGGGSGGALRLRSPIVNLAATSQININGGLGGNAPWSLNTVAVQSRGGNGSPGLVRVEDSSTSGDPISFESARDRVLPFNPLDPNSAVDFLSVAPGYLDPSTVGTQRPDTLSGGTSCWIRPEGNFLQLLFQEDTGLSVEEQGWTMDIELSSGALRPFRGTNTAFPNEWEGTFGNTFGSSPIVVRFQGGRSQSSSLADPCNVDENDPFGEVLPGSLTPWVSHPAELGLVTTPSGANYTPNMIRFCVLFDRTNEPGDDPGQTLIDETVVGVTNLKIVALPD